MLHHVEIYVSDLARSRVFYEYLLPQFGYELYQDWAQGFSMKKAEQYIVFVQTPTAFLETGYHRCRTGLNHLAFHGGSREEIDQLRKDLLARGVTLLYDDRYPYAGGENHYALYFEDPDGVKVEVVGKECIYG
ncbi:VOC family protein [Streptococcus pluranimalium]|uniref:VOC family protein n=1 Tax=Streptococcus pluranimalium TaxID=82348 RepID=UPI002414EB90|nr:VOC family protein [Streptococcus pluranimalium]WFM80273.1 VOC family protein [Streptococcus pluranimalium]HEM6116116.1 VOC family protein [Streptococcus suis]